MLYLKMCLKWKFLKDSRGSFILDARVPKEKKMLRRKIVFWEGREGLETGILRMGTGILGCGEKGNSLRQRETYLQLKGRK